MTSSTPNPSWMNRTAGSFGARTTWTCTLTQSATCAPGIDAYQNTAGQSTFWIDYPPLHSMLRISSTSPTRSPFPERLSTEPSAATKRPSIHWISSGGRFCSSMAASTQVQDWCRSAIWTAYGARWSVIPRRDLRFSCTIRPLHGVTVSF